MSNLSMDGWTEDVQIKVDFVRDTQDALNRGAILLGMLEQCHENLRLMKDSPGIMAVRRATHEWTGDAPT